MSCRHPNAKVLHVAEDGVNRITWFICATCGKLKWLTVEELASFSFDGDEYPTNRR